MSNFRYPYHPGRQPRDPVALALRFRHGILRLRFDPLRMTSCYTFFFPLLLSKMNRSLGLCFVRFLNPFANCPHGLTASCLPPPPFSSPWPPHMAVSTA